MSLKKALQFYQQMCGLKLWYFICAPVNCGDPGIPENAVREGGNFLFEDVVNFTCINGYYQSSGPEDGMRMCEETGLWSGIQPVCSCKININLHFICYYCQLPF